VGDESEKQSLQEKKISSIWKRLNRQGYRGLKGHQKTKFQKIKYREGQKKGGNRGRSYKNRMACVAVKNNFGLEKKRTESTVLLEQGYKTHEERERHVGVGY